jgi:YHS domain-containing protein
LIKVEPKDFASQNEKIAIDPVCGMDVGVEKATKTEYIGEVYHFCCSHCQKIFENNPEDII